MYYELCFFYKRFGHFNLPTQLLQEGVDCKAFLRLLPASRLLLHIWPAQYIIVYTKLSHVEQKRLYSHQLVTCMQIRTVANDAHVDENFKASFNWKPVEIINRQGFAPAKVMHTHTQTHMPCPTTWILTSLNPLHGRPSKVLDGSNRNLTNSWTGYR